MLKFSALARVVIGLRYFGYPCVGADNESLASLLTVAY